MNSRLGWLGALLAVQLVMVLVALLVPLGRQDASSQLFLFDSVDIDRLIVSDATTKIELIRVDNGWFVSGVPAQAQKMADILGKLSSINEPWPVASSQASAERFEVSEENFQRRIRLFRNADKILDLYLGTSPGYQRVHARRAGQNEVYSIPLSNYELGVDPDNWLDKSVLASSDVPSRIELRLSSASTDSSGLQGASVETLSLGENGWLYNDTAADQNAAMTYAKRFTTLQVSGLADPGLASIERGRIALDEGGGGRTLIISQLSDDGDYLIAATETGPRYRVATYIAEQLLMADVDLRMQDNVGDVIQ